MLKKRLLALIYPTRCPVCGDIIFPEEDICTACKKKIAPFTGSFSINGAESFSAPFEYNDAISPAVILLKKGIRGNAPFAFGKAMAELLISRDIPKNADMILPVPMHKTDKRKRGFNQAELIARELGERLGTPVAADCVEKVRSTEHQKMLTKKERMVNLRDAFAVSKPEMIRGKGILLVDDVCTTGSTLAEITRILIENGAREVHCACCCKTVIKEDE